MSYTGTLSIRNIVLRDFQLLAMILTDSLQRLRKQYCNQFYTIMPLYSDKSDWTMIQEGTDVMRAAKQTMNSVTLSSSISERKIGRFLGTVDGKFL